MTIDQARIAVLERENAELRERIATLERDCGFHHAMPLELGLTGRESRLLGLLLRGGLVTKDAAMCALYSTRPDDDPEIKIIDVFICKIRAKLKPYGMMIATHWGRGYELAPASRDTLRQMMNRSAA